jgi:hypothetical protein
MRQFAMVARIRRVTLGIAAAVVLGVVGTLAAATPVSAQNPNPGVLPPNANAFGASYGEWNSRWWQWALSIPASRSPLIDTTGANCAEGQSGRVWFLAGTFGTPAPPPVIRSCTVRPGTPLFFPVFNGVCVEEPPDPSFQAQLACARAFIAGVTGTATIDGRAIQALDAYRVESPRGFDITLPPGNVFGAEARVYRDAAGAGVYLLLAPLSVGQHTIHFTSSGGIDVTYNLTVSP